MNLDELQSVQSRERQTDGLQQLRPSFYEDAAAFINELREEREHAAERADDPFDSPDVNRLSDDIRTAEQTVEAIYERRVGKVVKMASLAAADMPTEREGLTKEETALFETMVAAIEDHRGTILDVLGGEAPAGSVASAPLDDGPSADAEAGPQTDDTDSLDAAAVMGDDESEAGDEGVDGPADREPGATPPPSTGESAPGDDSNETDDSVADVETGSDDTAAGEHQSLAADSERVTVRITEDVGEIFGVDEREYDLVTDDVVSLPVTNAEPLIDRDAAEPLE